jgi:hypothetical protein
MTGSGMGCWQVPCIAANTRRTPRQLRVGLRPGARANVASDTGHTRMRCRLVLAELWLYCRVAHLPAEGGRLHVLETVVSRQSHDGDVRHDQCWARPEVRGVFSPGLFRNSHLARFESLWVAAIAPRLA